VGYNSHDPAAVKAQIAKAKTMGISAFVVDWYGDRQPFIDQSYALVQSEAAKQNFKVAMMYDESNAEDGATDEALADLTMFHETYLSPRGPVARPTSPTRAGPSSSSSPLPPYGLGPHPHLG